MRSEVRVQLGLVHAHGGGLTSGDGAFHLLELLLDASSGLRVGLDGWRRSFVKQEDERDCCADVRGPANDAKNESARDFCRAGGARLGPSRRSCGACHVGLLSGNVAGEEVGGNRTRGQEKRKSDRDVKGDNFIRVEEVPIAWSCFFAIKAKDCLSGERTEERFLSRQADRSIGNEREEEVGLLRSE